MGTPVVLSPMDPVEAYARYQADMWDEAVHWAHRALGETADPVELRRAASRRFVRACLSYRAWAVRPRASLASEALLGAVA